MEKITILLPGSCSAVAAGALPGMLYIAENDRRRMMEGNAMPAKPLPGIIDLFVLSQPGFKQPGPAKISGGRPRT